LFLPRRHHTQKIKQAAKIKLVTKKLVTKNLVTTPNADDQNIINEKADGLVAIS
jgi:hypothetical protein